MKGNSKRPAWTLNLPGGIEVLQKQLAEHFAFEEVIVFRHLQQRYPEFKPSLQAILAQHTGVHEAFVRLRSALNQNPSQLDYANLLLKGTAFQTAFEQHATEETQLLNEISSLVNLDRTMNRQQNGY